MSDQFFIGREKELEKLEQFALASSPSAVNPRIAHIWGPEGIGKTAFVQKFASLLPEENNPILWFLPEFEDVAISNEEFIKAVIDSSKSNLGDLESWLIELREMEQAVDAENRQSPDFFWAYQLGKLLTSGEVNRLINLDTLTLVFLIDNFPHFTNNVRVSFCSFINRLKENLKPLQKISVVLTSEEDLLKTPDIYGHWESSLEEPLEIRLDNLSREETIRLLDAHDFDPNLILKIYNDTRGFPGALTAAINDQSLQSINSAEWYTRGKNLLLNFNNLQRKWMKWAAVIKNCNDEAISLLTEGQEVRECMNWIRSKYPEYFVRDGSDYVLSSDNRRAVLAYLEKDENPLFADLNEILQKFTIVKHAIPSPVHREQLSLLSELQYFDLPLLKKLFDEIRASSILTLIENKPIFFRVENNVYRLASNIRSSISIYNSLLNPRNRDRLRNKISVLWKEKVSELNRNLGETEKDLHENEVKNRSLAGSLSKIDTEIERLKNSWNRQQSYQRTTNHAPSGKAAKMIGASLLQASGIALLYIDILVLKELSLTYLGISALCIIGGILYGMKENTVEAAPAKVGWSLEEQEQVDRVLQNLELDRISLLSQKEKTRVQIESDKSTIITIQNLLKQPYLPEAPSE